MTKQTIAIKTAETKATEPVKVKEFDPNKVKLDVPGQVSTSWVIYAEPGMTAEDCRNPLAWKRVQGRPQTRLGLRNQLRIYADDDSWRVVAETTFVTDVSVKLLVDSVKEYRQPDDRLYRDDTYHLRYEAGGYSVYRNTDNQRIDHVGYTRQVDAINAIGRISGTKVA